MANQAKILLFNVSEERKSSIEKLCKSLSIRITVTTIHLNMYGQSMGYLAGISGFQRNSNNYTGEEFESEMLIFSGVDSDLMDEFLDGMKKNGIAPVFLKAMITPTNIFWTPVKLFEELKKEHQALHN